MTVRQVPEQAIDAPSAMPSGSNLVSISSRVSTPGTMRRKRPMSEMMPVNMGERLVGATIHFHQIVTGVGHAGAREARQIGDAIDAEGLRGRYAVAAD